MVNEIIFMQIEGEFQHQISKVNCESDFFDD